MRHLQSMELSDDEKLDYPMPLPMKRPDFPCGLILTITEREIEKLKIDPDDAEIGGLVHLFAMARVISVNRNQDDKGKECCRIGLQIEDLGFESEDDEEEPDE